MRKSVHSDDQLAFQALMRETRKASGLTQQALADKLGKPQSFIAKYERGERRLDVVEFIRIVQAMNKDPAALVRRLAVVQR